MCIAFLGLEWFFRCLYAHTRGHQFVCCALIFDRGKPLLSMPRLRQVPRRRPRENPAAAKYRLRIGTRNVVCTVIYFLVFFKLVPFCFMLEPRGLFLSEVFASLHARELHPHTCQSNSTAMCSESSRRRLVAVSASSRCCLSVATFRGCCC